MALQTQSGREESGTGGALKLHYCDVSKGCSVVSFIGSDESLMVIILEIVGDRVVQRAPVTSVTGCSLKFFRLVAHTIEGFPSQCSCTACVGSLLFLAGLKLSIQQLTGHAMIIHPDDISHPSQLGLDEYGLNPDTLCTIQDLEVCDMVLPADANYGMEGTHTKVLQLVDMPVVPCPSLIFILVLYSMCQHVCDEEIKQDWG